MALINRIAIGHRAETKAVAYLRRRGYRIVKRNYRCKFGEIDIIAEQGGMLVFVEVRSRRHRRFGLASDTVGITKQKQIMRVAQYYISTQTMKKRPCRFDVIGYTNEQVVLIRDAFRAGY